MNKDSFVEKKVAEFSKTFLYNEIDCELHKTVTSQELFDYLTTTLSEALEEGARRREQTLKEEIEGMRKPTTGHIEIEMGTGSKIKVPAHSNEAVAYNQAVGDILALLSSPEGS